VPQPTTDQPVGWRAARREDRQGSATSDAPTRPGPWAAGAGPGRHAGCRDPALTPDTTATPRCPKAARRRPGGQERPPDPTVLEAGCRPAALQAHGTLQCCAGRARPPYCLLPARLLDGEGAVDIRPANRRSTTTRTSMIVKTTSSWSRTRPRLVSATRPIATASAEVTSSPMLSSCTARSPSSNGGSAQDATATISRANAPSLPSRQGSPCLRPPSPRSSQKGRRRAALGSPCQGWTGACPGSGSGIRAGVGVVADTRLGALEGEVWTWLDGSAESWGPEPVGRLVERFLAVM
jgi:hypothetical protein